MVADELLGLENERRLHVCSLQHKLVALNREMFGEDAQQNGHGIKFALRGDRGFEIRQFRLLVINVLAEFRSFINGALERCPSRLPAHYLTGLQESNGLFAELHRCGSFTQTIDAGRSGWCVHGIFGQFFLHAEARRASVALPGHQCTEGVFLALAMEWQLPCLERAKRQRHPGRLVEGALVVLKHLGASQSINYFFVRIHLVIM